MTDEQLRDIFDNNKTIAAVGLSSIPSRPSHYVSKYLMDHGYRIIPVNPGEEQVLGEKAYASLADIPEPIDIVQIFRKPEHVPEIVEQAAKIHAKVVWMQDGAGNYEAGSRSESLGMISVVDDCMMRQHRQLYGDK